MTCDCVMLLSRHYVAATKMSLLWSLKEEMGTKPDHAPWHNAMNGRHRCLVMPLDRSTCLPTAIANAAQGRPKVKLLTNRPLGVTGYRFLSLSHKKENQPYRHERAY